MLQIFSLNTSKLESKTVSCHFIGYPEKSKSFRLYCPDRHTKFVEMRHAIFLDDEGDTVPREIRLEEKRVYVPTSMIHEQIPLMPVHEHTIPTFEVGSSSAAPNVIETSVIQEFEVPNAY
jgi:hypothetical protein